MLLLLPPSETKTEPDHGPALELAALSFPELTVTRRRVLDGLTEASAEPDAARRLGVPPTLLSQLARNLELRQAPTAPAAAVYSGPLYDGLGWATLDAAARRRAAARVVIISPLWGALRPTDLIPAYRLHMCGRLAALGRLPDLWRAPLNRALPVTTGDRLVLDFRVADYASVWRPVDESAERTILVRIVRPGGGRRGSGGHRARHTRGLLARHLVAADLDPAGPQTLAKALAKAFTVGLYPARRPGAAFELDVVERS